MFYPNKYASLGASNIDFYYIELTNGEKLENALSKMINNTNSSTSTINKYNSAIKGIVDNWYENNMLDLEEYINQDAVFCASRTVKTYGGWAQSNSTSSTYELRFVNNTDSSSLGCTNISDRFSKNNNIAKLNYPVGLLSYTESYMMEPISANRSNPFWLMTAESLAEYGTFNKTYGNMVATYTYSSYGVRPVIVLKEGLTASGNGTSDEPYIIDTGSN